MSKKMDLTVLACPKCFCLVDGVFMAEDGEILLWMCPDCDFQGEWSDFLEFEVSFKGLVGQEVY